MLLCRREIQHHKLESPMYSRIDKRFYIISLGVHLIALGLLLFISHNMDVVKTPFLVYGVYSNEPLCAFFKPLPLPQVETYIKPQEIKPQAITKKQQTASPVTPPKVHQSPQAKEKVNGAHKQVEIAPSQKNVVEKKMVVTPKEAPAVSPQAVPPQKAAIPQKKEQVKEHQEKAAEHRREEHPYGAPHVQNFKHKKLYCYQRAIQHEVTRIWKPPLGVSKGAECALFFVLDDGGNVKDFKVVKSSGIPLYDLSIIKVVQLFQFDKIVSGKRFMVTFRQ